MILLRWCSEAEEVLLPVNTLFYHIANIRILLTWQNILLYFWHLLPIVIYFPPVPMVVLSWCRIAGVICGGMAFSFPVKTSSYGCPPFFQHEGGPAPPWLVVCQHEDHVPCPKMQIEGWSHQKCRWPIHCYWCWLMLHISSYVFILANICITH